MKYKKKKNINLIKQWLFKFEYEMPVYMAI